MLEFFLFILACLAGKFFLQHWKRSGKRGEQIVKTFSLSRLSKNAYHVYHDLLLPSSRGDTTQIDHIVFSRFGIFVIETKDYSGWIFAGENNRKWTQVLRRGARGSRKYSFQNPFHQNVKHIKVLQEITGLPEKLFYNFVAFIGDAEFKTPIQDFIPPNKFLARTPNQLPKWISSFQTPVLSEEEVNNAILSVLGRTRQFDESARQKHVRDLRNKFSGGAGRSY